ncbi:DUF4116 domain-containing protein [Streptobacillus moniliformis]|uniref:DUF4116 domain-containing protein n=1 Tax=Streptobacillus moniliformis TaxID=34105 RepID=UPI0007E2F4DE|nr:DUF4116 domain-containing protein [Streptobacillus moniliformis]
MDWNNKKEVLKAVKQDGWALEFASEELKNDKEVVMAAVKQNGDALQFASERLRNNEINKTKGECNGISIKR